MQRPSVKYFTIEPGNVKTIRVTMPDSNKIVIVIQYQYTQPFLYEYIPTIPIHATI